MVEKEIKDATVCVVDMGQFQETAFRLARDFKRVLYYKPWKKSAPTFVSLAVGDGFAEIERVRNLFDVIPEVDLFVFPDLYDGDLQLHLESLGKRVWGSRKAEEFEFMREKFKQALKDVGLPVAPYKVVEGMTALRDYLKKHEDQHIKISLTRGDGETWHHINYDLSRPKLDSMDYYYGPAREYVRFVVEEAIETSGEVGYDGITIDGQFTKGFVDYEVKNQCCIAAVKEYEDLPEVVRMVNDKFAPKLKETRCRSMWGTEIRVSKKGTPYFIDATSRQPSPPGELELELFGNLSEIMWHGSVGEFVEVEETAPFGVEIMLYSNWKDLAWLPFQIPDKVRQWVKLSTSCMIDDNYYCIPNEGYEPLPWGREEVGMVVGIGDTVEEAIDAAKEHAEQLEGFDFETQIASLAEALERIEAGEKEGVEFSDEPLPEPASVLE